MVTMAAEVAAEAVECGRFTARRAPVRTKNAPLPARLTSRGRIAVTGVSALLVGVLSVGLAATAQATHSGAQATHSGQPSGGRYLAKVLVRPGQNLWSLAGAYDPDADPRQVVDQIRQLNAMTGDQLQAGQQLWVPRG
jgi:hypothetical protein